MQVSRFIGEIKIKLFIRYEYWRPKPSYDSLIHKSKTIELKEIKADDSYKESEINDLK